MDHPLMSEQLALEEWMLSEGKRRFLVQVEKARATGREATTGYGMQILSGSVEKVATALTQLIGEAALGKAGNHFVAIPYIAEVDAEVAAVLALRAVLNSVSSPRSYASVAIEIGASIEDEAIMRRYKEASAKEFSQTIRTIEEASTTGHYRRTVARRFARTKGNVTLAWTQDIKLQIGGLMIDLLHPAGLFKVVTYTQGRNDRRCELQPTEAILKLVQDRSEVLQYLTPSYLPTIIPPKPWTSHVSGGYWSPFAHRIRFTIGGKKREHPEAVYEAVNAVQNTAWRVNTRVLEVLDTLRQSETLSIAADLPPVDPVSTRPFPEEGTEEDKKAWKIEAKGIHRSNIKAASARKALSDVITVARKMQGYEAIYFPHRLDFRGRAYSIPLFLSPQGCDYSKALLTFSQGEPIETPRDAGWLAIHGANTYGYDKVNLAERVQWVYDHEPMIRLIASDPLGEGLECWTDSAIDKPFCFLAWCFEWASFLDEGYGFVSHLPIAMDGSCNGIQHYSAVLRDEEGGRAVNLVPSPDGKPADIYQTVADKTVILLNDLLRPKGPPSETLQDQIRLWDKEKIDPDTGEVARGATPWRQLAKQWLAFGISRKISKRSVMTLPYGIGQRSSRDYIQFALKESVEKTGKNPFRVDDENDGLFAASLFLQPIMWEAITDTVVAAREAMAWLKGTAKCTLAEDKAPTWTTPDGFVVSQRYMNSEARRVKTHLAGSVKKTVVSTETDVINKREHINGIAPNWVHSMDATAMRMAVLDGIENGVTSFAVIHDSFGTHAAKTDIFGVCIRQSFVSLYTDHDPLKSFRDEMQILAGDDNPLDPIPPRHGLDISQVMDAEFFFA